MLNDNALQPLSTDFRLSQERGTSGPMPLYHQLYLTLKFAIRNGTIPASSLLPGELTLAAMFNVSRVTVKRALDELAGEKLVTRSRGRGTIVSSTISAHPWRVTLAGRFDNLAQIEEKIIGQIISVEKAAPGADIRKLLSLDMDQKVHKVTRLRTNSAGDAYAYHISYTPGITRGFTKQILQHRARIDVIQDNGIAITEVEQITSAENASGRIASCLDVEPGTALLMIRRIARNEAGRIVDVMDSWFDTRRYQYATTLMLS
ncbi:MAG: GntR family transcriptional regulator [Gammaproteobacteria bacterium]